MELHRVREIIKTARKGANIRLVWTRPAKVRKGAPTNIEKHVEMTGRMGLGYDNINNVQERRENGDAPAVNAGLPWGEWEEFPFLIKHKESRYLRLYKGSSEQHVPRVEWRMDGKPVEKSEIAAFLLASEKDEERDGETFTCKVEHLERVGVE